MARKCTGLSKRIAICVHDWKKAALSTAAVAIIGTRCSLSSELGKRNAGLDTNTTPPYDMSAHRNSTRSIGSLRINLARMNVIMGLVNKMTIESVTDIMVSE